jgi:DNA replication protein DnaC
MKGYYFQWNADSRKLRTAPFEDRDAMYEACKTPDLLYIDDLFKGSSDPNDKEVQLVFEILNYRYNNRLTTILSSEMTVAQLLKIDQATVSRILQLCDPYIVNIEPDTDKNYRLHGLGKKVL